MKGCGNIKKAKIKKNRIELKKALVSVICIAVVLIVAGCQNNSTDSKTVHESVSNVTKEQEQTTVESTTVELTTVEPTTVEITTQAPTPPPTEAQKTKEDTLKEGMWISYSPQDVVFDAYVFSDDGILEKTGYSLVNGNVQEYMPVVFQTYRIRGNQILINDKSGKEWTWYFTDDEDTLEYAYQDGLGGETYAVSQKIRHYDSLPDYDTAMSERKNKS